MHNRPVLPGVLSNNELLAAAGASLLGWCGESRRARRRQFLQE